MTPDHRSPFGLQIGVACLQFAAPRKTCLIQKKQSEGTCPLEALLLLLCRPCQVGVGSGFSNHGRGLAGLAWGKVVLPKRNSTVQAGPGLPSNWYGVIPEAWDHTISTGWDWYLRDGGSIRFLFQPHPSLKPLTVPLALFKYPQLV